jgi:hypothetical protein
MELTTSLEYYMFLYNLNSQWYNKNQIYTLVNPSLIIFNESIYHIVEKNMVKLDIKKAWFYSMRWINWQHPFFFLLNTLVTKHWGEASYPNNLNIKMMTSRWKFHALNSLYKKREKYIWNIMFAHNIKISQYKILQKFIYDNIWKDILIKKDFRSCWEWNYPVDLKNFDEFQSDKFNLAFETNDVKYDALYIVPIEEFSEEYRIYFTKVDWKIKIHSIKKKEINITKDEIMAMKVFEYWGSFTWSYIENIERKSKYKKVNETAKKLIKNLDYTSWILEFWKTIDWRFVFFEVNGMWAVMPYKWEDTKNITKYYHNLFKCFNT